MLQLERASQQQSSLASWRVLFPYFAENLLLALNLSPYKYSTKTPAMHTVQSAPSILVPGPMPMPMYMGRLNMIAANATRLLAASLPANKLAAY